jgi:GNAT superfamily N-acetyltransferase
VIVISEVDRTDEPTLRAFWAVEQASQRHDREHAMLRSWDRLHTLAQGGNEYYARTFLVADDGERVVGAAETVRGLKDNLHLADLEVNVLPERRREGIGRALYDEAMGRLAADGRTSVCGEVYVPGGDGPGTPAYDFAARLGFEVVHREDHLMLGLPVPAEDIEALRARAQVDAAAYEILTWQERCPDEHVEAFAAMRTRMENDVPIGEIDYEPVVIDVERLRAGEERTSRSFRSITAVARRLDDGEMGGYSLLYLPHGADYVYQDDTLVMPEHRGHRLGTLLKCATLEIAQREHPERVAIHTDTAVDHHAMQATNRHFGYRPVERLLEMQRRDG